MDSNKRMNNILVLGANVSKFLLRETIARGEGDKWKMEDESWHELAMSVRVFSRRGGGVKSFRPSFSFAYSSFVLLDYSFY